MNDPFFEEPCKTVEQESETIKHYLYAKTLLGAKSIFSRRSPQTSLSFITGCCTRFYSERHTQEEKRDDDAYLGALMNFSTHYGFEQMWGFVTSFHSSPHPELSVEHVEVSSWTICSELAVMVRATIASAKAQQQMNVYGHGGGQTEMHNNHHHKRSLVTTTKKRNVRSFLD